MKVINIFAKKKPEEVKTDPFEDLLENMPVQPKAQVEVSEEEAYSQLQETMRKNAQNKERMKKEADKANKSVLRSYRIKE